MRRSTPVLLALTMTCTLAACSGSSDPNLEACDAFAYYLQDAGTVDAMDRATTADQVRYELHEKQPDSDIEPDAMIDTGLGDMENTVDGNDTAWTMAADTMAAACMDYGWTAD